MKKNVPLYKIPLATASHKGKIVLFSKIKTTLPFRPTAKNSSGKIDSKIVYTTSTNGITFSSSDTDVHIFKGKKEIPADTVVTFKIHTPSDTTREYTMILEKEDGEGGIEVVQAISKNLKKWVLKGKTLLIPFAKYAVILPKEKGRSKSAIYYSDREMWVKIKKGATLWGPGYSVIGPRIDSFDSQPLEGIAYFPQQDGLFILYGSQSFSGNAVDVSIGAVLCSHNDPGKVLWRSTKPLWQGHFDKTEYLVPIGGEIIKKKFFLYWMDTKGDVIAVALEKEATGAFKKDEVIKAKGPLKRSERNPIIVPRDDVDWEANGTLNPGAFLDDHGHVHLFYRAIGSDGVSRIGYAESIDGIHFLKRSLLPVFEPDISYEKQTLKTLQKYDPSYYISGGSWMGAEDPRVVCIDDTVYLTFNLLKNWSMRVSYISMSGEDFRARRFEKWDGPYIISFGMRHKNWVLFPEKINGKFGVLHSIIADTPDRVRVVYTKDLKTLSKRTFTSPDPQLVPNDKIAWHVHMRSAGPPPIKVKDGWLVLYHAHELIDTRYKLGAMILDKNDPTKVLYRANVPILSPDMYYENDGKPGVVYVCGAVIKNNKLYIYYGGGDKVVCVAVSPIDDLLKYIKEGKASQLSFIRVKLN